MNWKVKFSCWWELGTMYILHIPKEQVLFNFLAFYWLNKYLSWLRTKMVSFWEGNEDLSCIDTLCCYLKIPTKFIVQFLLLIKYVVTQDELLCIENYFSMLSWDLRQTLVIINSDLDWMKPGRIGWLRINDLNWTSVVEQSKDSASVWQQHRPMVVGS